MKRYPHLIFLLCGALPVFAQKRVINQDWEFLRLADTAQYGEMVGQGTDWDSQFNVEHVNVETEELRVPEDTLKAEFNQLNTRKWENVHLPHTPFIEELTILHQWQGICYYRKNIEISTTEAEKRLWLEFEGAMHLADVWINGKHVAQHAGGYTPFVIDVTGMLNANARNELMVRLDNRNNPLIPPGKPVEGLDFCYYGGIYRDVNLIVKPDVHITHPIMAEHVASGGVFVTYPNVSAESAEIRIQTEIANQSGEDRAITLSQQLYTWSKSGGKDKRVECTSWDITLKQREVQELVQTITVNNPMLWSPDAPNLYILSTEIIEEGKVIDREEQRIGVRHLEMSREKGFVINGTPLRLVGCNRHMEYPYVGNALPPQAQYRDMYQIRSNGFNIVRLGHYPQDSSVLDACDELGLLAIEAIPGWQFFNDNPLFISLNHRDLRHMIRRDRNHPSIAMWETTLNESWPPDEWKDEVIRMAHDEFPGDQCFTSGDAYGYDGFDVCYNDWEEGFKRPNTTSKPGFIREYYDYEFGGQYSTTRISRGDGEVAQLQNLWNAQWSHNRYNAYYPWTMGDAVWSMYDFNSGCNDKISRTGLADIFRLPKFGLSFFRCQVPAGTSTPAGAMPYEVFIPSYRTGEMSDTMLVYGNVDEVELSLNGRSIERKKADEGEDTEYVSKPDGGNCKNLPYPPFTFTGVPTTEGELKAIGYVQEEKVAEFAVRTPGSPEQLDISYFESGKPASRHDLLIVHARLLDEDGTLCPLNGITVDLHVSGGEIIGPATYPSEAGIASFLVKTGEHETLRLEAKSENIKQLKNIPLEHE